MATLRKLVARALNGANLASSDVEETAIDRIAAMAFGDALGSALWRLQLSHDAASYRRAIELLARRARPIVRDRDIRRRLCDTVLREWLDTLCRHCGGRGVVVAADQPTRSCPVCEGTSQRRYSDQWRMARMRFTASEYRKWEPRFAAVHAKLSMADAALGMDIAANLGRMSESAGQQVLASFVATSTMGGIRRRA